MNWAVNVGGIKEKEEVYILLVGKPEEKRSLESPMHRRVDKIKTNLGDIGWTGRAWIRIGISAGLCNSLNFF
jgi:hypothetical protein